jgi:predicted P-loop ATPase
MNDSISPNPDTAARIMELEMQLARIRRELDFHRADAVHSLRDRGDWKLLTPEEEAALMTAPQGESLRTIISEFERMGEP